MWYFGLFGGMAFAGVVLMYKPDTRYVTVPVNPNEHPPTSLSTHSNNCLYTPFPPVTRHTETTDTTASRHGQWARQESDSKHLAKLGNTSPRQTLVTPMALRPFLRNHSNIETIDSISLTDHGCDVMTRQEHSVASRYSSMWRANTNKLGEHDAFEDEELRVNDMTQETRHRSMTAIAISMVVLSDDLRSR